MAIRECTVETNNISQLPDEPALSPTELKAEFDQAGTDLKNYINNSLITDVNQTVNTAVNGLSTTITSNQTSNNTRFTTIEGNITTLTNSIKGKQKTITSGTSAPSGGSNGDIYIQYF